jgi:hypothetical protein
LLLLPKLQKISRIFASTVEGDIALAVGILNGPIGRAIGVDASIRSNGVTEGTNANTLGPGFLDNVSFDSPGNDGLAAYTHNVVLVTTDERTKQLESRQSRNDMYFSARVDRFL